MNRESSRWKEKAVCIKPQKHMQRPCGKGEHGSWRNTDMFSMVGVYSIQSKGWGNIKLERVLIMKGLVIIFRHLYLS